MVDMTSTGMMVSGGLGGVAAEHVKAGREAEHQLDRWSAISAYRQAMMHEPDDAEVCFRLAYHLDLVGEVNEALSLYEHCCSKGRAHINALVNLSILYEDQGQYARAERCLKQVLETDPNHARARLYMKDVQASRRMFYDEEMMPGHDKESAMLELPITDFELSVRARNCLRKMNIRTVGDLLRTTEADLMSYKNFGETSLLEIKAALAQKGLRLGQALDSHYAVREEVYEQLRASGQEEDVLDTPVSEMNLSVRARKALALLNIATLGELVSHTEDELLGIKNFGATSLDEIKEYLEERGMSLRRLEGAE